ncbi:MAG: replication factor C large subunit [Methanoregulaceae archaeon]|nr:replication factor C large subunit [Methanoregulaceae archaeon]
MDWTEKYRPLHLRDIVGNSPAIRQIFDWAKDWTPAKKPLILYGKPGTGKTSAAYALARAMEWEVVELNASDQRTRAVIEHVAGTGSTSASLTGHGRRLIILDEADQFHGSADFGGAKAVIGVIRDARQPIILIANNLYGLPSEIRARCEPVQFRALQARSIVPRLREICTCEGKTCSDSALRAIAESAGGDMRAAVMMLYAAALGRTHLDEEDIRPSGKDERVTLFELVIALFSGKRDDELVRLSREADDTPDTILSWAEANVSLLPDTPSRALAYQYLARADEYIGLTYRKQYYMLWRYATAMTLLGMAEAASGKGIHARVTSPPRWQRMAAARRQKSIRISATNRLSGLLHIPQQTFREGYMNLLSILIEGDPEAYAEELGLDPDQLNLFLQDRELAAEVSRRIAKKRKALEMTRQKERRQKTMPEPEPDEEKPGTSSEKRSSKSQATLDGF